ncbi:hypothetical protein INR49_024011 [Caranx melampygus]|nr:hypothetical protein INR49_024011 [Caranx melampygus]
MWEDALGFGKALWLYIAWHSVWRMMAIPEGGMGGFVPPEGIYPDTGQEPGKGKERDKRKVNKCILRALMGFHTDFSLGVLSPNLSLVSQFEYAVVFKLLLNTETSVFELKHTLSDSDSVSMAAHHWFWCSGKALGRTRDCKNKQRQRDEFKIKMHYMVGGTVTQPSMILARIGVLLLRLVFILDLKVTCMKQF